MTRPSITQSHLDWIDTGGDPFPRFAEPAPSWASIAFWLAMFVGVACFLEYCGGIR